MDEGSTPSRRGPFQWVRRLWKWFAGAAVATLAVPLVCDLAVAGSATVHSDAASVPHRRIALVLGTNPFHDGRTNLFYKWRLDAAAELYATGVVDGILVSGDNGTADYNEPEHMRDDLVARGVPAEHVTCDYAGFRTLDSVVRAKEVFGLDTFVVVSQPFHAERAVFLARGHGIDAVGFGARNPALRSWLEVRAREVLARTLAVADLALGTRPRFLGPPVEVPSRTATGS